MSSGHDRIAGRTVPVMRGSDPPIHPVSGTGADLLLPIRSTK
jgi:hypothetical protein